MAKARPADVRMAPTHDESDIVWADILGHVRTRYSALARSWFGRLRPGPLEGGELTILAADTAQFTYLTQHCHRPFTEAAQATTGRLLAVRFLVPGCQALPTTDPPSPGPPLSFEKDTPLLRLNGDYRFEHFVVGPCNRLAHASCLAISEAPGTCYNPLFLHGSVGLGKTHLLHAVCHEVLDRSPAARVSFLSCETFVNHFIEAVEKGALDTFRYRYRHVDLLLIDDIQFLAGHDRTQEEFFHTFNTLYQLKKQIVLSADSCPLDIPSLEDRLISRFNWGLVARIDAPCLETRQAIIQKKMKIKGMDLAEGVALFIASRIKSNTRDLEGALNRVHALACLDGGQADMAVAKRALSDTGAAPSRIIRIQDIMSLVTDHFNVKLSDLQGRRRSRSIALPRQVGMYLARQHTEHSLGEIGGFFGGRDHTTVIHANKLIAGRREADPAFSSHLAQLEADLRQD
jgi:chromosomal replication initiator protein